MIFATRNKGKMREIQEIMRDSGFCVQSMDDAGIGIDIVEDGLTFEENAAKKASEVMLHSGKAALADDSGLEIDFLDKQPGVYSARYMGEDTPYSVKNARILEMLADVPYDKRTARFVCVIAFVMPDGRHFATRAAVEGYIYTEIKGENGFGYDPIFFIPEYGKTMAELSIEEKNEISHRGKALRLMSDLLKKNIKEGDEWISIN